MRELFRPPNLLTCVRIALTPLIVFTLISDNCVQAFWLSLTAGFTDAADGYLARRLGETSALGRYLDPIADKILLTTLFLSFGLVGLVPGWLVWLVVGRDVMILTLAAGGRVWKGVRAFPPTVWGKLSTGLQIVTAVLVLSGCAFGISPALVQVFVYATACATAWSGIHYLGRAVSMATSVSR
jgi:cardiolipin synthase (CMP-forming)